VHLVYRWAEREARRLLVDAPGNSGAHPLARIEELYLGGQSSTPTGKETALGKETRRYSRPPEIPTHLGTMIPEDESDRIMRALGEITNGRIICTILYLWGLGVSFEHLEEHLGKSRKTIERRADCGLTAIELAIQRRSFKT
jgi:hypothetical protein